MAERVFVIAEAGSMHNRDLATMKRMIEAGAKAGCDAVKFQWVSRPERLCERRNAPGYLEAYGRIAFKPEWHVELHQACQEQGVEYMCTAYLPEDLVVVSLFVKRFKVASFETGDRAFVRRHLRDGREVIISTGLLQNLSDEAGTFHWLLGLRRRNPQVKLLHCVSAYPAPIDQLNLGAIRWHGLDGFSDHTGNVNTGAFAVAAGARILEVHFRPEDADPQNPDYDHSLDEGELVEYIQNVREVEAAMGDGVKRIQECEKLFLQYRAKP